MNSVHRTLILTSAALALSAALTGCTAAIGSPGALIPTLSPETPTASATPAPLVGDRDGNGSVSEFEKEILAKAAPRDYTMPDGSVVQVDPTQPLPPEVVAVIAGLAAPIVADMTSPMNGEARAIRMADLVEQQTAATGRNIVIFHHTWSIENGQNELWWVGKFPGNSYPVLASADRAANLAAVTAAAEARNAELIIID